MRSYLLTRVVVLVALVAGAVASARAGDLPPLVTYNGTGGVVTGQHVSSATADFNRLISQNVSNGIDITDTARGRAGASDFDMLLKRNVSRRAVEKAGAALARGLPVVGTAITLWDIWNEVNVRPDGQGGLKRDEGTAEEQVTSICAVDPYLVGAPLVCSSSITALTGKICGDSVTTAPAGETYFTCEGVLGVNNATLQGTFTRQPRRNGSLWGDPQYVSVNGTAQTTNQCPAVVDALNPQFSRPAGGAKMVDGTCPTGRYTVPITDDQAADRRILGPAARVLPQFLDELQRGGAPQPDGGPGVLSGPGTVAQPGTVTTTGPGGTTTTNTPPYSVIYGGNSFTWSTTTVTVNNDGSTTTTTAPPEVKTCGLPNTPACKIDETGTPTWQTPQDPTPPVIAADAARRNAEAEKVVDPGLGWFEVPPMVECTPFDWPGGLQINPCPGMEHARTIMGYLWAFGGLMFCFGTVRSAVTGG